MILFNTGKKENILKIFKENDKNVRKTPSLRINLNIAIAGICGSDFYYSNLDSRIRISKTCGDTRKDMT